MYFWVGGGGGWIFWMRVWSEARRGAGAGRGGMMVRWICGKVECRWQRKWGLGRGQFWMD